MEINHYTQINTILQTIYTREKEVQNKINEKLHEDDMVIFYASLNDIVKEEQKTLYTSLEYLMQYVGVDTGVNANTGADTGADMFNDWEYKYEYMLAYNNHKDEKQFYSTDFTRATSFVMDFCNHVLNITTLARDFNKEHLTVLQSISYILDVKYMRGQVSHTENWVKDLWEHFTYIINSKEQDSILDLWQHGNAFRFTLGKHNNRNQFYSANDRWSYEYSFMATLYLKIYHNTESLADTKIIETSSEEVSTASEEVSTSEPRLMLNFGQGDTIIVKPLVKN